MRHIHQQLILHTVTPLHVGCGQDVGVVDLPVIRERTTGYPYVPGSGVRGPMRAHCREVVCRRDGSGSAEEAAREWVSRYFGPEAEESAPDADRWAGSLSVHDAELALFPVRSQRQPFVWITCPQVLARLSFRQRTLEPVGSLPVWGGSCRPGEARVLAPAELASDETLYLEEFGYQLEDDPEGRELGALARWAGALGKRVGVDGLASRTVLVNDAAFHFFVQQATVVEQHNRLSLEKTVVDGALFSVESLPPETVLTGFLGATTARWPVGEKAAEARAEPEVVLESVRDVMTTETRPGETLLHLGGKESTGLGLTRLIWPPEGDATSEGEGHED